MEDILQNQADLLGHASVMKILDEKPVGSCSRQQSNCNRALVLKFTKLVAESAHELMSMGNLGNVSDLTLRTRIEDITKC